MDDDGPIVVQVGKFSLSLSPYLSTNLKFYILVVQCQRDGCEVNGVPQQDELPPNFFHRGSSRHSLTRGNSKIFLNALRSATKPNRGNCNVIT